MVDAPESIHFPEQEGGGTAKGQHKFILEKA